MDSMTESDRDKKVIIWNFIYDLLENHQNAMNKTGEVVNATANELGKNASDMGSTILNKTVELDI